MAWRYRAEPPAAPPRPVAALPAPVDEAITRLNFGYAIRGAAPWRPVRVFDDGVRTYVEFAPSIVMTELPPLFVMSADGKPSSSSTTGS